MELDGMAYRQIVAEIVKGEMAGMVEGKKVKAGKEKPQSLTLITDD